MKTIDTPMASTDPVMSEVRKHKQAIAQEFGFDVLALGRYLQERQAGDRRFVMIQGDHDGAGNVPSRRF